MDDPITFELVTTRTDVRHTITVVVHETQDDMIRHLQDEAPDEDWGANADGDRPAGVFQNAGGFMHNDAPMALGIIRLNREYLDIATIVHELTHAAMFIYQCDRLGVYSRAMRHINPWNEMVAYLIGDLAADLAEQLHDRHLYDGV